jgi:hypothetical protein
MGIFLQQMKEIVSKDIGELDFDTWITDTLKERLTKEELDNTCEITRKVHPIGRIDLLDASIKGGWTDETVEEVISNGKALFTVNNEQYSLTLYDYDEEYEEFIAIADVDIRKLYVRPEVISDERMVSLLLEMKRAKDNSLKGIFFRSVASVILYFIKKEMKK